MHVVSITIKPLDILMLRGVGEFDPSSRGVFSYASSLYLPRPSTLIGLLCSIILELKGESPHSHGTWDELLNEYVNLLNKAGIKAIRGPYIRKRDEVYVPLYIGKEFVVAELRQVKYFLSCPVEIEEVLNGKTVLSYLCGQGMRPELLEVIKCKIMQPLIREKLNRDGIERLGIGLQGRSEPAFKGVKEGYIYTARYVAYPKNVDIAFETVFRDEKSKEDFKEKVGEEVPVKFGGEHRIARLRVENHSALWRYFKKNLGKSFKYALLVSPLIVGDLADLSNVNFIGILDVIGLGYSLAVHRRKPIYQALLEGSIVCLRESHELKPEAFSQGLYELLGLSGKYESVSRLGFGSFVPIG